MGSLETIARHRFVASPLDSIAVKDGALDVAQLTRTPVRYSEHQPTIGYLGKDTPAFSQTHSVITKDSGSPGPLISPTNMYPGPQSPYSYFSTQHSAPPPGYISPPDSRRAIDEEKERHTQQRQSLPSIHEALGNESPLPYPGPATSGPPTQQTAHPSQRSSSLVGRPGGEGPPGPPNPFSNGSSTGPFSRDSAFQQPQLQGEVARSAIGSINTQDSRNPSLHSLASSGKSPTQSAKTGITSVSGSQNSGYDYCAPTSAPGVTSPGGYGAIPRSFSFQSQPPPGAPSYPTSHHDNRPYMAPSWKPGAGEPTRTPMPGHPYGDSVKRHLDIYDVESSLNEVCFLGLRNCRSTLIVLDCRNEYARFGLLTVLRDTSPPNPAFRACYWVSTIFG